MLVNLDVGVGMSDSALTVANKGFSIKGVVKKQGISIPCRVRLFEKLSGKFVGEVLTDTLGNYKFDHLAKVAFLTIAHDPASQFNAVIQDMVVPK